MVKLVIGYELYKDIVRRVMYSDIIDSDICDILDTFLHDY